ncbi:MAG: hypothetical protein K6G17_03005 [Oscillospiraceae bacterium]|nr:hypothetical protein [Oscillospiraceae bacterium]
MTLSESLNRNLLKALTGQNNGTLSVGNGSACWLGLSKTDPGATGSGFTELSGKGYARTNIAAAMNNAFRSASLEETEITDHARRIGNSDQIAFHEALDPEHPEASTGGDWDTATHFGLFTARTGGTLYAWGALDSPVTVNTHEVLLFRDGCFELYTESAGN